MSFSGCSTESNNIPAAPVSARADSRGPIGGGQDQPLPSIPSPAPSSGELFAITRHFLGEFRHPFLGKAELLLDDTAAPRLVLNDRWTARVTSVRELSTSPILQLTCYFDNIPWLPQPLQVSDSNGLHGI